MSWPAPWTTAGQQHVQTALSRRGRSRCADVAAEAPAPVYAEERRCSDSGAGSDIEAASAASTTASGIPVSHASGSTVSLSLARSPATNIDDDSAPQVGGSDLQETAATLWRRLPPFCTQASYGYGRSPAFWWALNFACNRAFGLHRFHHATFLARGRSDGTQPADPMCNASRQVRQQWAIDNGDLVTAIHAVRVNLLVCYVMGAIVPTSRDQPFQYWWRFGWGKLGNPHVHGKCYAAGNPTYECIVDSDEARKDLITHGRAEALELRTRQEAEEDLGNHFGPLVFEWHPCKDETGKALSTYVSELLHRRVPMQPQCIDLLGVLDEVFGSKDGDFDV